MNPTFLDKITALPSTISDEFAFCQLINLPSALFITEKNALAVKFKPSKEWKNQGKQFSTEDEPTPGYQNPSPRLVILKSSQLSMFENKKRNGKDFEQYFGRYDSELYYAPENKGRFTIKARYLLLLVDEKGNSLTEEPLTLTTKGAIGKKFNEAYLEMKQSAKYALKQLTGKSLSYDSEVYTYLVFHPTFKKYNTQYNNSVATEVGSFVKITPENIEQMLVLSNPDTEQLIKSILESNPNIEFKKPKPAQSQDQSSEVDEYIMSSNEENYGYTSDKPAPALVNSLKAMVDDAVEDDDVVHSINYTYPDPEEVDAKFQQVKNDNLKNLDSDLPY